MTASFLAWWRQRSLREQRLLLVMFALLAVTLFWLGIYRPIRTALSNARAAHVEAVVQLGEIRAQRDTLNAVGRSSPSSGPVADLVARSATEAGFAEATVAGQGDRRASVSISSARAGPVLGWIAGIEAQGIVVERFAARANPDATLTVDLVLGRGG